MALPAIALVDLTRQAKQLQPELNRALRRVIQSGRFILGPEVARFEEEFARFCGARYGVGVASGTDALELALRVAGVGPGDRVATVSFTFFATVDAILHVGAEPVFVDIDPKTYTMAPDDLADRIRRLAPPLRRRLKAVIPVHLYGQPCSMDAIGSVARRYGLRVIEDAAQAAGAAWRNQRVGSIGDLGCFSFFPSKNLGGCGDGGMVLTSSSVWADRLRALRHHGRRANGTQGLLGRNSRLDELQAALLRVKLRYLPGWIQRRRSLAKLYNRRLEAVDGVICPEVIRGGRHAFHLYVLRSPRREELRHLLRRHRIASEVYYPVPVHHQPIHRRRYRDLHLPETERAAREVLALPLFPELRREEINRVSGVILDWGQGR